MALTDPSAIIVRGVLQDVSLQYRNAQYVADQVFPIIDGLTRKTKVAKNVKAPWFRDEAEPRAPGTAARVGGFKLATEDITPVNYAFATMVPDEEREEANVPGNIPLQPDIDGLEYIANKIDLKKEIRVAALLHASNWSGVGAGGEDAEGHWGDGTAANDTFLADLKTGRDKIQSETGVIPNSLFLTYPAWSSLQIAPALLALMNPTKLDKNALVTTEALKALAQVENLIIGMALKITDEETVADTGFTPVNIWGTPGSEIKGMGFLYYRPAAAGRKTPSAGYQYRLKRANGQGRVSTAWRDSAIHSDMYDTEESTDIVAVGLDLGYMWKDTATT